MKRCPNCNGSIIRLGNKEKPFLCKTCNKWFSEPEVTPKQTNADRIRNMTDEELDDWLSYICDAYYMPSSGWLGWLKKEIEE